ncbi:MAG: hypothetical protein ACRC5C_13355 [Bacilli bacterium]
MREMIIVGAAHSIGHSLVCYALEQGIIVRAYDWAEVPDILIEEQSMYFGRNANYDRQRVDELFALENEETPLCVIPPFSFSLQGEEFFHLYAGRICVVTTEPLLRWRLPQQALTLRVESYVGNFMDADSSIWSEELTEEALIKSSAYALQSCDVAKWIFEHWFESKESSREINLGTSKEADVTLPKKSLSKAQVAKVLSTLRTHER